MAQGEVLSTKDPQDEPGIDGPHQCLAIDQGERVVLVFRHLMQLGLEPVQLANKVLLVLNLTALTFRMVSIDQAYCPCYWYPPLVLPGVQPSTLY